MIARGATAVRGRKFGAHLIHRLRTPADTPTAPVTVMATATVQVATTLGCESERTTVTRSTRPAKSADNCAPNKNLDRGKPAGERHRNLRGTALGLWEPRKHQLALKTLPVRHCRLVPRKWNCVATSAAGLVSRVTPVHTALRNCTRDEGRSFEVGNQVLISSHRKLLLSKATVVNVAETSG